MTNKMLRNNKIFARCHSQGHNQSNSPVTQEINSLPITRSQEKLMWKTEVLKDYGVKV